MNQKALKITARALIAMLNGVNTWYRDTGPLSLDEVSALGLDERFQRLWRFYFAYCEGGFRERWISVVHLVATKPDFR